MVRESLLELLEGKQPCNTWILAHLDRPRPVLYFGLLNVWCVCVCVCVCVKITLEVMDLLCILIVFVIICHYVFVKSHRSVK